jgi:hypothetical protein
MYIYSLQIKWGFDKEKVVEFGRRCLGRTAVQHFEGFVYAVFN